MTAVRGKTHKAPRLVIFTDLDGTLLDSAYSFRKALPALRLIKEKNIPLLLCSSKTATEMEHFRKKIGNHHPFITENGGGIYIPKDYFGSQITNSGLKIKDYNKYTLIKLGASYEDLRKALEELRDEGYDVKGFGDMSAREVAGLTGLKLPDAARAKMRDFDEPFVFRGSGLSAARLRRRIRAKGLNYTQGEFLHIMGDSDKGRAVGILKRLYGKQGRKIITAALGDSPNDIEMLQTVDHPFVVKKKDGSYNQQVIRKVRACIRAGGIGPEGWNSAVLKLIDECQ